RMADGKAEAKASGSLDDKPAAAPPAATAAAAASQPAQTATMRYVDRPDLGEVFADSVNSLIFDGQMLRVEFGGNRFDDMKPNQPVSGRRLPACRLVLPPSAAVELINRMQQVAAALTQAGLLRQAPPGAGAPAKAG